MTSFLDDFAKSQDSVKFVIPAKAGIQFNRVVLGSRLRESDGFSDHLRDHLSSFSANFLPLGTREYPHHRPKNQGLSFHWMAESNPDKCYRGRKTGKEPYGRRQLISCSPTSG
jgi:hypothetical protein